MKVLLVQAQVITLALLGNKNYTTMKKYINLYALAAIAMFIGTACTDDIEPDFEPIEIIPGNEIQFGASAFFENAEKKSRTIYGDVNSGENLIEVNWVPDSDFIQIVSPHTGGADVAEYKVTSVNNYNENGYYGPNGSFVEKDHAKTLKRIGEAGLQWSNGSAYEFYAMYPSHNKLKEIVTEVANEGYGLEKSTDENGNPVGTMTGYLPVTQDPLPGAISPNVNGQIKIEPDMRYAYMVAKEYYEIPEDGVIDGESEKIQLNFESLVTALNFDIVVNEIGTQSDKTQNITIMALSLTSGTTDLCGKFVYTFPQGEEENIKNGSFNIQNNTNQNYRSVTMSFGDTGIPVGKGDCINVTFFVLPSAGIDDDALFGNNDLKLNVRYKVAGKPQSKTATIKKQVVPRKYTYFKNVLLPKIENDVSSSVWWSLLPENTLFSQVSIPVASNVFASSKYFSSGMDNSLQQVKDYTDLWDIGVRGFEFVNRRTVEITNSWGKKKYSVNNNWSLSGAHFVVDENPYENDNVTFGNAFNTLAGKLAANPNETLVVICTYQAINDGYDPDGYVRQLLNYLDEFVENNTYKFTKDDFVQLTAASTVGDIQGKIAIIIRPGDDDRYEDDKYTSGISLTSKNDKDWSGNVLLIEDWGTAFDVWDRRYEGVAREAQFDIQYRKEHKPDLAVRTLLEDWLWGAGDSSGSSSDEYYEYNHNGAIDNGNNNFDNFGNGNFPKALDEFKYEHIRSDGGKAYVQEWARVVPESMAKKIYTGNNNNSVYLWVNWRESYTEKKQAIDGLFMKTVATKGKSDATGLYINSLSGYYIIESEEGIYPFKQEYATRYYSWGWKGGTIKVSNMGKGGDHVGLAYDLNKYVYGILSGESEMTNKTKLAEGPWGLVMMEHIGNTTKNDDKSIALVDLIMMNNFRFPLAQSSTPKSAPEVKISNEMLNPEAPLLDWK